MPSAFFGLNTGLRALMAAQTMLETSAHNTANASTPGFSRQRVHLVAADPYSYPTFNRTGLPGQIGTGVSVATIERVRDAFLDFQIQGQTALKGYWDTRRDELSAIESVFPEPSGSGLGTFLSRFWAAWHDVASDPSSTAARAALVETARTLASRINRDAGNLATLGDGLNTSASQRINDINDIAARIAALNTQIQRVVVSGDHANDLEDQRDLLIEQLNGPLPATAERQADGTVTVMAGGTDLVNHDTARRIVVALDANDNVVPTWASGGAVELGQAALGALVEIRDTQLATYRTSLNELAKGVADAVNALHVTGTDATGAAGLAFFTYTAGSEASTLAVNAAIAADPQRVVAAAAAGQPGDGSIAGSIADLQTAALFASGSQTTSDFYAAFVGRIGADTRQAAEMATNQELVVGHLTRRRESISGVSLDEEAADMIRFQHAYTAAARVITAVDEMLDQLINRTGIVGR